MFDAPLAAAADLAAWRSLAGAALAAKLPPDEIAWRDAAAPRELHATRQLEAGGEIELRVPRGFPDLAETVICHASRERFALLYRLLWRIVQGERALLEVAVDPDVRRARTMAQAVRRDMHKMRAFVRFRRVADVEPEQFVAWFEPDHHIVEANAPFFQRRFAQLRWSILTPGRSVHWDGARLAFAPGTSRKAAPDGDALEALWRTYYGHIFNPARLKVQAMRAEMPKKYWRNLPEAGAIRGLVRAAEARVEGMVEAGPSLPPVKAARWVPRAGPNRPAAGGLPALHRELSACARCELHRFATQAVPGEGPI
ncbi:MAG TPA: TIGR03915 family putative DNA repair protein, partial [Geminicoccaceae bacterium]